jgi:hypothetical protein
MLLFSTGNSYVETFCTEEEAILSEPEKLRIERIPIDSLTMEEGVKWV